MLRMEDNDASQMRAPWTPNSGMKLFSAHSENVLLDQLLDNTASPMRLVDKTLSPNTAEGFRSPSRTGTGAGKRSKAPPSPATAMLLNAARAIEEGTLLGNDSTSSPAALFGGSPILSHDLGPLSSPVSQTRTPSRLLFSPSEQGLGSRGIGSSPSNGMMTSYDGMLNSTEANHSQGMIGSIWKQSASVREKNAKSTARRPLLQQTPMGKENNKDDPVPHSARTPTYKTKTQKMKAASEPRKDRKAYSTAGRPRVRGEYKCGKCGFYPKKSRHDCDEERARQEAAANGCTKMMRNPPAARLILGGNASNTSPNMKMDIPASMMVRPDVKHAQIVQMGKRG